MVCISMSYTHRKTCLSIFHLWKFSTMSKLTSNNDNDNDDDDYGSIAVATTTTTVKKSANEFSSTLSAQRVCVCVRV